jgi:RND superfamily putative drug exporter
MLTAAMGLAAIVLVLAARAVRGRVLGQVPVRVRVGDTLMTTGGTLGIVERLEGSAAQLRIAPDHSIWVERGTLLAPSGAGPPPEIATAIAQDDGREPRVHPPPIFDRLSSSTFGRIGGVVADRAKTFALVSLLVAVVAGAYSSSLQQHLTSGGFLPKGEAMDMRSTVVKQYGQAASGVVVLSSDPPKVLESKIAPIRTKLESIPLITRVSKPLPSPTGKRSMVIVGFKVTENVREPVDTLEQQLRDARISNLRMAGAPVVFRDIAVQTQDDLTRAEMIGMPIALLVLLFVFGTFPAAVLPLVMGGVTVMVSLGVLRGIASFGDLSIYILNISSMLGLSLGIDYSLLGVTRFREELERGASVRDAVVHTVSRAGVAAAVSGVAVVIGLSGLMAFPVQFLRDVAVAGMVVVVVAVLASMFVLPAMLALLGHRVERFPVRKVKVSVDESDVNQSMWMGIATRVMRHPIIAIAVGATVLAVLASSLGGIKLGVPWAGTLPHSAPSRAGDRVFQHHFGVGASPPIWVAVDSSDPASVTPYVSAIASLRGVAKAEPAGKSDGGTLIKITVDAKYVGGARGRSVVQHIRQLDAPGTVHVGGQTAEEIALVDAMGSHWLGMMAWIAAATFLVLLVAFRSIVLPLKAILLNVCSISAAIGAVTHVFQGGHGIGLLGASRLEAIDVTLPAILFAILFGLSMDYEVFMLARIAELYGEGDDNEVATARGLAWTAPLVTGAALILAVVGLSFATADIVIVKQIGFGLAVALMLDATIVRCLLVPAMMRCFGDRNWWLPRKLSVYVPRVRWSH